MLSRQWVVGGMIWLGGVLFVLGCGPAAAPVPSPSPTVPLAAVEVVAHRGLTGTASCSGRACHGGLHPAVQPQMENRFLFNEHTVWLAVDRHANAYRTLFNERSRRIARLLDPEGPPAHQNSRCLACHVNPLVAGAEPSTFDQHERLAGVGCEACHGGAENWLVAHTTTAWESLSIQEKRQQGMFPINDMTVQAQVCAGCHVGAGPQEDGQVPARDVNHDLIAAGHPRLNFEFAAYRANLPTHWHETALARTRPAYFDAQAWAIGQVVSAQAALELLAYRAAEGPELFKPWPEFAEYDCFACHHDLRQPSPRQERGYGKYLPGSLPWNDWYYAMPLTMAHLRLPGMPNDLNTLNDLAGTMRQPLPNRNMVREQAEQAQEQLVSWLRYWQEPMSYDPSTMTKLRAGLTRMASEEQPHAAPSWDAAAQLYLALFALDHMKPEPETQTLIQSLVKRLRFPIAHADGQVILYDSPSHQPPTDRK
ncbi:MAG: multiheme c-type cytochrome [Gemmataceae bacterium]